ncbi:MAG: MFS transporter, partial [Myxococcota bacterium]|nr:MFS transporter [Myxococcota bacterium]
MSAVSPAARRLITLALLVGTSLASLEAMVVGPAMPAVVGEFGGAGLYPWVFTAYIGAQTLTMPLYGVLADRRGRRAAYLLGVTLFLAGSLVSAMADSMAVVVAGRLLQGLGAGAILPVTQTIFGDLYPVEERTRMQGWFSLIWGLSSLLGPAVGGWLTEAFSWRAVFWLNLAPGLLSAFLIGALVPASLGRREDSGPGLLAALP